MSIEAIAWAFKQPIENSNEKFVLVALADNADTFGICFPSYKHIHQKTGISLRTIKRCVQSLVDQGIIIKAPRNRDDGSHSSNAYWLTFNNVDISEHPLYDVFEGGGVTVTLGGCHGDTGVVSQCHPINHQSNHQLTERENAQGREWFLREIDKGYKAGRFQDDDLGHLTESEIISAAKDCHATWGDDLRGRDCPTVLRTWLKKGLSLGSVRKASKPSRKQEVSFTEPDNPMQPWHERAKQLFDPAIYQTYFRPAEHDGNGTLYVAKSFHADYITRHYEHDLNTLFPNGVELITKPQKEKELAPTR